MKPLIFAAALATTMLSGGAALSPSDCDRAPWGNSAAYKALKIGLPDPIQQCIPCACLG